MEHGSTQWVSEMMRELVNKGRNEEVINNQLGYDWRTKKKNETANESAKKTTTEDEWGRGNYAAAETDSVGLRSRGDIVFEWEHNERNAVDERADARAQATTCCRPRTATPLAFPFTSAALPYLDFSIRRWFEKAIAV